MTQRSEQFPPLAPERYARWSQFGKWDIVWFPKFLGIELQPAGVVHGGVIASLVDTVVVPVVGSGYDSGALAATATLTYKVSSKLIVSE